MSIVYKLKSAQMLSFTKIINKNQVLQLVHVRQISCSTISRMYKGWREENGFPENPNSEGPMAHWPDYTFLDGRPTPLGSNQKKRLLQQQEIASKIVEYSKELQFAKDRFERKQQEKNEERQKALQNKLKPKGHLLLQQKTK